MNNVENVIAFLSQATQPRTFPRAEDVFETHRLREAAAAAERGDLVTLEALKNQGADLNEVTPKNVTLLMFVLAKNDEIAVRCLLAAGADPNVRTKQGTSAMLVAMTKPEPNWIEMLLERRSNPNLGAEDGDPLVHQAISLGAFQHIEVLIRAGVPVDVTNAMGQTPALRLAYLNQFDRVSRLLDMGADPEAKDQVGLTIRKLAVRPVPNPNSPLEAWRKQVAQRLGIEVDGR